MSACQLSAKTRALERLPFAFCVHRTASFFYQTPHSKIEEFDKKSPTDPWRREF